MLETSDLGVRKKVVLVDDDQALLNAVRFSLETEGFDVAAYSDGETALAGVRGAPCACLILDQNLPGLSGLDLLSRLRTEGLEAPAIVITSNPTRALHRRAAAAGAEIVEKPLLGDTLNARVRDVVRAA